MPWSAHEMSADLLRFEDPALGNDPRNEFSRGDIEGWVMNYHIFGGNEMAAVDCGDF